MRRPSGRLDPSVGVRMQRPWDEVFALAWASFLDGTTPVGAALVDLDGEVVATGRGRRYSSESADGQLAGSRLAHAEINALVGIDPFTDVRDHTLLSTLEPCSLCVGASIQARVGAVVHAGRDPYGGATSMVLDNHQLRLHRPVFSVEDDPDWRDVGAILLLSFYLDVIPNPRVVAAFREATPELAARAETGSVRASVRDAAADRAEWGQVHALLLGAE
jgi:tRNA(Arg) A34 adenosine deaminase TadA